MTVKTYDDLDSAIAAENPRGKTERHTHFLVNDENGVTQYKLTFVCSEEILPRARKDFKDGGFYISKDDEIIGFVAL